MRLDAVRRLLERLRVSGGRRLDEDDASFTSSELAVGRMVVPLLDDLDAARRTIDDLGTNTKALAVALDLLPVAAIVMDAAGRFLTSNAAARSLFGGAAIPSAVLEAAAKGLAIGTERTVTAIVRPDGALLRAVPADVAAASVGAGAGPGVVFLVPVDGAIDVPAGPLAARYGLSPTQAKVVTLVARGLTNKEVAQKLDLSPETVKKHLDAVFQRTGVNTRAAVVALAFGARYGLAAAGGLIRRRLEGTSTLRAGEAWNLRALDPLLTGHGRPGQPINDLRISNQRLTGAECESYVHLGRRIRSRHGYRLEGISGTVELRPSVSDPSFSRTR